MTPLYINELRKCLSVITHTEYDAYNFLYCLIRHLYPNDKDKHYKALKTKYFSRFNLSDIQFPCQFKDIEKLYKHNSFLH